MTETTETTLDLETISERYFAAWEARDPDAIVELHTEDTQFQTHAGGEPARGREAVRQEFAEVFERFPGFGFDTHRVILGPSHWVLDWDLTFDGPDGERKRFHCLDVVEISAEGLVASKDTFIDFIQLQAALPDVSQEASERVEAERAGSQASAEVAS